MNGLTADVGSPRADEEPDQVGKILRHAFASKGDIEVAIEGWNHGAAALTLRIEGPYDNGMASVESLRWVRMKARTPRLRITWR